MIHFKGQAVDLLLCLTFGFYCINQFFKLVLLIQTSQENLQGKVMMLRHRFAFSLCFIVKFSILPDHVHSIFYHTQNCS